MDPLDEGDSESWRKQRDTEETMLKILAKHQDDDLILMRNVHKTMLTHSLSALPRGYMSLDASRPWVVYWITAALSLLAKQGQNIISDELETRVVDFFNRCQAPTGGFGGGPGQIPHLAPCYAAVNAIASIGTEKAYEVVNRKTMLQFLLKMKQPDGSFSMQKMGESDIRSTYCALSVASVLNLLTPEITHNAAQYIASCQTYEGGFGGEPYNEAHGGYTFCGLAATIMLGNEGKIDVASLLQWLVDRQMRVEGGFQGRTNKLVDSCYSFWQGASFPMINAFVPDHHLPIFPTNTTTPTTTTDNNNTTTTLSEEEEVLSWYLSSSSPSPLFCPQDLQKYLLFCCQDTAQGGFRDKPPMRKDLYHTFYSLAGLSVSQNITGGKGGEEGEGGEGGRKGPEFFAELGNLVGVVHPVHGVEVGRLVKAKEYYAGLEKLW